MQSTMIWKLSEYELRELINKENLFKRYSIKELDKFEEDYYYEYRRRIIWNIQEDKRMEVGLTQSDLENYCTKLVLLNVYGLSRQKQFYFSCSSWKFLESNNIDRTPLPLIIIGLVGLGISIGLWDGEHILRSLYMAFWSFTLFAPFVVMVFFIALMLILFGIPNLIFYVYNWRIGVQTDKIIEEMHQDPHYASIREKIDIAINREC